METLYESILSKKNISKDNIKSVVIDNLKEIYAKTPKFKSLINSGREIPVLYDGKNFDILYSTEFIGPVPAEVFEYMVGCRPAQIRIDAKGSKSYNIETDSIDGRGVSIVNNGDKSVGILGVDKDGVVIKNFHLINTSPMKRFGYPIPEHAYEKCTLSSSDELFIDTLITFNNCQISANTINVLVWDTGLKRYKGMLPDFLKETKPGSVSFSLPKLRKFNKDSYDFSLGDLFGKNNKIDCDTLYIQMPGWNNKYIYSIVFTKRNPNNMHKFVNDKLNTITTKDGYYMKFTLNDKYKMSLHLDKNIITY